MLLLVVRHGLCSHCFETKVLCKGSRYFQIASCPWLVLAFQACCPPTSWLNSRRQRPNSAHQAGGKIRTAQNTILADLGELHSATVGQKSLQVPVLVSIFGSPFRGKGFLAADESAGPWLRAGHAEAAKIPDTGPERLSFAGWEWTDMD